MAEYSRLLRRWAWLLVICPLTAAVAAGAISREVPLVYQATATVLVIQAQPVPIDSSQASSNVSSTPDQVAATYAELMTQPVFLNKISSELHLGWSTSELASKIKVTPQGTTTVLVVTVSDTNARRARSIANTLINDFSAWQVREAQQRLGTQIRDAQSQVTILKGRVSADQAQINSVINGQQNQATLTGQATLNELQQQLTTDSTQLQTAESGLTQLQSEAALASDSVVVVSPASVPSNSVSPSRPLTVLLAGVAGLLLAVGLVLLINYLDQTVKDDEELQRRTGLTPIGHIPFVSASKTRMGELIVLGGPPSASEAYRSLRTNLQFASVDRPVKTIVVTSPGPGEGKSRTAANLAIVLAVAGHTTLLLDANFRHPCVHGFFGRASKHGFSELILNDGHQGEEMIRPVREVPGLSVLAAGVTPPNPSELLGSTFVKALLRELASRFDYVVLDSPSVNAVTDPALLASQADATVLVVEDGHTDFRSLIHAKSQLDNVNASVLGVVINKLWPKGAKYGYAAYTYHREGQVVASNGSKGPTSDEEISVGHR